MKDTVHRFLFNMPKQVYFKVREIAFKRNISMSKYVIDSLIWRLSQEDPTAKDLD